MTDLHRSCAAPAAPQLAQAVVAGALFDFLGFLTTSAECWTFSSRHEAGPAVQALERWAAMCGLCLSKADVAGWKDRLHVAAPEPEPTQDDRCGPHKEVSP